MSDLRYIIVCQRTSNHNYRTYQCGEPKEGPSTNEWLSTNEWRGGFTFKITDAILYPDYESAKKVCNRLAKIYSDFKIRVISKEAKEMFVKRLEGIR